MIDEFDLLIKKPKENIDKISALLKQSSSQIINNRFQFSDTLFEDRGVEIKLLLQSYPKLFWQLWDHLGTYSGYNNKPQLSEIDRALKKDGITILKNYYTADETEQLRNEHNKQISALPSNTDPEVYEESCKYRHYIRQDKEKGTRVIVGSPFDTKNISLYSKPEFAPKIIKPFFSASHPLNKIVSDYIGAEVKPFDISFEEAFSPSIYRENDWWHIDNLSDQYKIMIIVKDMTEKDGPFKFIKGTHENFSPSEKSRYHKMYAMMGIGTHQSTHFDDAFVEKLAQAEAPLLHAGDAILFDTKIHHSWQYSFDGGARKNILIAYFNMPTPRNKILGKIDSYLKFQR